MFEGEAYTEQDHRGGLPPIQALTKISTQTTRWALHEVQNSGTQHTSTHHTCLTHMCVTCKPLSTVQCVLDAMHSAHAQS
mmetsp:Transcript_19771/g.55172  ORF Transcript_19771/g.55172 Transcript_19771/m.55172 type:complete len:80 (+) Transcript_19771:409-648(+)